METKPIAGFFEIVKVLIPRKDKRTTMSKRNLGHLRTCYYTVWMKSKNTIEVGLWWGAN